MKGGWVIYHRYRDMFAVKNNEGVVYWAENIDSPGKGMVPLFCHTQQDVVDAFHKGTFGVKHRFTGILGNTGFKMKLLHDIILVRASGVEEHCYVDSTNFDWWAHIGRFYEEYVRRYGYPEGYRSSYAM